VTSPCPTSPLGRSECAQLIIDLSAERGTEIHVSTQPPLVRGPYENAGFRCPHGVEYWIAPTGEQIARWVETRAP
jgi:hypothetical protein